MEIKDLATLLGTGAVSGFLGAGAGWMLRTASSLSRNEREFLNSMAQEMKDLRAEHNQCQEHLNRERDSRHQEVEKERVKREEQVASLQREVLDLVKQNSRLETKVAELEGTIKANIESFR